MQRTLQEESESALKHQVEPQILIPSFPGSNPGAPANVSGLAPGSIGEILLKPERF
jgi:hypothetical protein